MVSSSKPLHIHILKNTGNQGDIHQAKAVQRQLHDRLSASATTILKEWDISELEALQHAIGMQPQAHHAVIGVGDKGVHALSELHQFRKAYSTGFKGADKTPTITLHWQGHQPVEGLVEHAHEYNTLALPIHTLSDALRQQLHGRTILVPTVGVAHDLQAEAVEKAASDFIKTLHPAARYYGVFLGGDAPTNDGKMRYFTKEEAAAWGRRIGAIAKADNALLLITNGPRTGKHDPKTGAVISPHKGETDPVSQAFLDAVKEVGAEYRFHNFDFNKMPSAYQPILGTLRLKPHSKAFVTAESTSMLSEVNDLLTPGALRMLPVGSMNDGHTAYMDSLYHAGQAHILSISQGKDRKVDVTAEKTSKQSAAQVIADGINDAVKQTLVPSATPSGVSGQAAQIAKGR